MDPIADFLSGTLFAVAGASRDRSKFGNRVLRALLAADRTAVPVHPREESIEGMAAVRELRDLPEGVHGLSIVTPPAVTLGIVEAALEQGIRRLWMQPGAEHADAIERAQAAGATVIHVGACILVELSRRGS